MTLKSSLRILNHLFAQLRLSVASVPDDCKHPTDYADDGAIGWTYIKSEKIEWKLYEDASELNDEMIEADIRNQAYKLQIDELRRLRGILMAVREFNDTGRDYLLKMCRFSPEQVIELQAELTYLNFKHFNNWEKEYETKNS